MNARHISGILLAMLWIGGHAIAQDVVNERPPKQGLEAGEAAYKANCAACHQPEGQGVPHAFPPLAKSDFLMADVDRSIDAVLHGLSGPIEVNGAKFDGVMPAVHLPDRDVASVLTFVRNSFGNDGEPVTPAQVAARR